MTVLLCDRQLLAGQCGCGLEPTVHVPPRLRALWRRALGTVVQEGKGHFSFQLDTQAEPMCHGRAHVAWSLRNPEAGAGT